MMRHDFVQGGFPISRRSPVICIGIEPSIRLETNICYNRFDLKKTILQYGVVFCKCIGIWPGKKTTDGFNLDPAFYSLCCDPPEGDKDIDSAENITVVFHTDNTFFRVLYTPGAFAEGHIPVISEDEALYDYVKAAGLRFTSCVEPCPSVK
jgi:hypothetical protein